jgi:hypothetical protein
MDSCDVAAVHRRRGSPMSSTTRPRRSRTTVREPSRPCSASLEAPARCLPALVFHVGEAHHMRGGLAFGVAALVLALWYTPLMPSALIWSHTGSSTWRAARRSWRCRCPALVQLGRGMPSSRASWPALRGVGLEVLGDGPDDWAPARWWPAAGRCGRGCGRGWPAPPACARSASRLPSGRTRVPRSGCSARPSSRPAKAQPTSATTKRERQGGVLLASSGLVA